MIFHCGCGNTLFGNVYLWIYIMYLYLVPTFLNATWQFGQVFLQYEMDKYWLWPMDFLKWLLDTFVVPVSSCSVVLILESGTAPCLASLGANFSYSNWSWSGTQSHRQLRFLTENPFSLRLGLRNVWAAGPTI